MKWRILILLVLVIAGVAMADWFGSSGKAVLQSSPNDEDTYLARFQMGGTGGDADSIRYQMGDASGTSKVVPVIYDDVDDSAASLLKAFTNDTVVVSGAMADIVVDVSDESFALIANKWYWVGFHVAVEGNDVKTERSGNQDPWRLIKDTGNPNPPDPAGGTDYGNTYQGPDCQVFYTPEGGGSDVMPRRRNQAGGQ